MRLRVKNTTERRLALVLGVLAGAGLGWGALAMLPPPEKADGSAEAGTTLREAALAGFAEGEWRIEEPMRTRVRTFWRDPADGDVVQIHLPERPSMPLAARQADVVRFLLGDVDQFLRSYRIAHAPVWADTPLGRARVYEWRKDGCDGCAVRQAWFDAATGRLVRLEERTRDGTVFRTLAWQGAARPVHLTPMAPERERTPPKVSERDVAGFEEFVSRVPFPLYEPSSLPPGFVRVQYGYDDRPPRGDPSEERLPIAWIAYGDGMLRMNLFLAPPDQMRRLEALSRRQDAGPGPSTCPSTPADTPEDLIEGAGAITVRRKSDGCRTVLRRDDLDGVVVALVGYPGLPADVYVRTIRGLVRVSPEGVALPHEEPLHPVGPGNGR
jgi:hypothetical protein